HGVDELEAVAFAVESLSCQHTAPREHEAVQAIHIGVLHPAWQAKVAQVAAGAQCLERGWRRDLGLAHDAKRSDASAEGNSGHEFLQEQSAGFNARGGRRLSPPP